MLTVQDPQELCVLTVQGFHEVLGIHSPGSSGMMDVLSIANTVVHLLSNPSPSCSLDFSFCIYNLITSL